MLDTPFVREVLGRLAEYEDLGLTPDVIKYKLEENEQLKADLRGKDNEIGVLKWRVEQREKIELDDHKCCDESPF